MEMIKPFTYDREDTCSKCNSERSIEAYDYNGNPLKLSLSIDRGVPIKQKNILYLKCKNCKAEFFPNWITEYPTPMTDSSFELFMGGYKVALKESETG